MPYLGSSTNAEFGTGITPGPVSGHANMATVAPADQYDNSWEAYQRQGGTYQPGQMESLEDQIGRGSDDE